LKTWIEVQGIFYVKRPETLIQEFDGQAKGLGVGGDREFDGIGVASAQGDHDGDARGAAGVEDQPVAGG
jgi:hypothetical protein